MVGRELAEGGASLEQSLAALRSTTLLVRGDQPRYEECEALSTGWSDSMLSFLHRLSCADPLTGLATLAHLRERIGETYRALGASGQRGEHSDHSLVVVEMDRAGDRVEVAERVVLGGETARGVFAAGATVARVGTHCVAVLIRHDRRVEDRADLLRRMLESSDGVDAAVRVEVLPAFEPAALALLDELARH